MGKALIELEVMKQMAEVVQGVIFIARVPVTFLELGNC
jgi:hypothetical protein